jgi:hypothetical protein
MAGEYRRPQAPTASHGQKNAKAATCRVVPEEEAGEEAGVAVVEEAAVGVAVAEEAEGEAVVEEATAVTTLRWTWPPKPAGQSRAAGSS